MPKATKCDTPISAIAILKLAAITLPAPGGAVRLSYQDAVLREDLSFCDDLA